MLVVNPATEEPIAELEQAGVEETDAAVARARTAFAAWRRVAPTDRAQLLRRLATLVEENAEELARIESQNVGKPIAGARAEVGMVAQVFHFYAGAVDKHYGETIPVAGGVDMTFREPLGVVGLIVPWNFPLNIATWKLGPARVRQHGRAQAGGADAAVGAATRRARARRRDSRRCRERPGRAGARRRTAARRASRRGQDRLHRVDGSRPNRDAGRCRDDQACHARARRQVGERRLRGCRSRARRSRRAVRRLRQRGPGLLCAFAHPRRAFRVRALRGAAHRRDARRQGRGSKRGGDRDGAAHLRPASGDGRLVRRRGAGLPRRGAERQRLLVPLHARRGDERGPGRARRGLRPRGRRDPVCRRGRRDPDRQRHALWAVRLDLDGERRPRASRREGDGGGRAVDQLEQLGATVDAFGGAKQSGFGRELGMHALEGYSEVKNVYLATD